MIALAVALSLVGVLKILLAVAIVVLLIVGLRWLVGLAGWSIPQPMWAILGFIVIVIVLIWLLGGSGGITVVR